MVNNGESMVNNGESMVNNGESMVNNGQSMVNNGESMDNNGESMDNNGDVSTRIGLIWQTRMRETDAIITLFWLEFNCWFKWNLLFWLNGI